MLLSLRNCSITPLSPRAAALAARLVSARQTGALLDCEGNEPLTDEEAMAVQAEVMRRLGESAPASKVALNKAGRPIAAPIFGGVMFGNDDVVPRPSSGMSGLEVEIAVRLGRDLTPELAASGPSGLMAAIETVYLGVELLGARLAQPKAVNGNTFLADNLGNAAYVLDARRAWTAGLEVEGLPLEVQFDEVVVHSAPARHPFGGVLVALERYALAPDDQFNCCGAGRLITTGTLCGVLPIDRTCRVAVKLGSAPELSFTIGQTGKPQQGAVRPRPPAA